MYRQSLCRVTRGSVFVLVCEAQRVVTVVGGAVFPHRPECPRHFVRQRHGGCIVVRTGKPKIFGPLPELGRSLFQLS